MVSVGDIFKISVLRFVVLLIFESVLIFVCNLLRVFLVGVCVVVCDFVDMIFFFIDLEYMMGLCIGVC